MIINIWRVIWRCIWRVMLQVVWRVLIRVIWRAMWRVMLRAKWRDWWQITSRGIENRSWKCFRKSAASHRTFKTLATVFLNYRPTLRRQITFFFPHSLKSIFSPFHFHPHKHAALCKFSKLTDVVKRNFFILIFQEKPVLKRKLLLFNLLVS